MLRAWSPVCGTILGDSGNFRIWHLSRGNKYLGVGFYWHLGTFHSSLNPSCPSAICFHQDASRHMGQVTLYWALWNAGLKCNIVAPLSHFHQAFCQSPAEETISVNPGQWRESMFHDGMVHLPVIPEFGSEGRRIRSWRPTSLRKPESSLGYKRPCFKQTKEEKMTFGNDTADNRFISSIWINLTTQ